MAATREDRHSIRPSEHYSSPHNAVSVSPSRSQRLRQDRHSRNNSSINMTASQSSLRSQETDATSISNDKAQDETPAFSKKFVVVGDGGCGKTCFLISYSQGYFPQKYVPTVFENYLAIKSHPRTGQKVELALWDTAGQEEYDRLRPLSYPETDLLFVCFAIDCPNSLENVMDKWFPEVTHFCPLTPLILVGLKSDLRSNQRCIDLLRTQGLTPVTSEQGRNVARQMNASYMECSSKEMRGVDEIFQTAINTVVDKEIAAKQPELAKTLYPNMSSSGAKAKKKNCKIL